MIRTDQNIRGGGSMSDELSTVFQLRFHNTQIPVLNKIKLGLVLRERAWFGCQGTLGVDAINGSDHVRETRVALDDVSHTTSFQKSQSQRAYRGKPSNTNTILLPSSIIRQSLHITMSPCSCHLECNSIHHGVGTRIDTRALTRAGEGRVLTCMSRQGDFSSYLFCGLTYHAREACE